MIYSLLLLLGIMAVFGETILILTWIYARLHYAKENIFNYKPKTCIIIPCKGIGKDFKSNIEAICDQDYPHFNVIFVIDSKDDPTYSILQEIVGIRSNARLEFSDLIDGCSGKISALIKGVNKAGNVDVYVFADSDIQPHKKWLQYLVDKLNEDGAGATTGFRWYFPQNITSSLISTWNMISINGLFYSISNYTWGGSTAIKKTVFNDLDVESKWKKGLADDLILTESLKNNMYKIRFIPQCIVESPPDEGIKDFIRWGTRQLTWMRWYYPSLWFLAFCGLIGVKILTGLGFILLFIGFYLPGLLMISTILLEMMYGYVGFTTVKKMMCYPGRKYNSAFHYVVMMPAAFFLFAYNIFISCFKREIEWGGRIYKKSDFVHKE